MRIVAFLSALLVMTSAIAAESEPYIPANNDLVLETVQRTAAARKAWQRELHRDPHNVDVATRFAQTMIEAGRTDGDPRDFGYAQAALAPWWDDVRAPSRVVLLRATIRQWRHDFPSAMRDLDALIAADTAESDQARLTRSSLRLVQGDPVNALRDCSALIGRAGLLTVTTCIAVANSLRGHATEALDALNSAIGRGDGDDTNVRLWALTASAEIADRLGRIAQAQQRYQQALALSRTMERTDPYLLASYSDFLLDQGQSATVATLLAPFERIDNLLLRHALAELALADAGDRAAVDALQRDAALLQARFDETRQRGDAVHQREEALFLLLIRKEPQAALAMAQRNWSVQREPLDARLLLLTARSTERPDAARPVLEWMRITGIEDRHLKVPDASMGNSAGAGA